MRRFDTFVCIDWSGEAVARPVGIALAWCRAGDDKPVLLRPDRGWSRQGILDWLLDHASARTDMLIGLDLSPALPFADCGAYLPGWADSPGDARTLWTLVDHVAATDPHLSAGSFADHSEASRHYRRHDRRNGLRVGDLFGIGRLRATEAACRAAGFGTAQSVFNLVGAAQVGKSSLTGMRLLHRLAGRVPIWPFDPVPASGPLIVEVYTTIAARAAGVRGGSKMRSWETLDAALAHPAIASRTSGRSGRLDDHSSDAILTAAWLRRAAADPALWHPLAMPAVRDTEGWTFGVR